MTIKHKKKKGIVYLEEYKSVRVNGKVKSVYIRSLGPEKPKIPNRKPTPSVLNRLEYSSSFRSGDVSILWEIAKENRFVEYIDGITCGQSHIQGISPGKLITAWAINRVIDPLSTTKLEKWIPTTDIPLLMDANPADFNKEALLSSLDFICREDNATGQCIDNTTRINDALYQNWRKRHPLQHTQKETVAYDITSVLFFGVKCPIAELGHNANDIRRHQVNLALVISKHDKYPLGHFIFNGSRHSASTIKNLLSWLTSSPIEPGTIIWDRGNVSKEHISLFELSGWKVISGIPMSIGDAKKIVKDTVVPTNPNTFVQKGNTGHIYANRVTGQLFNQARSVVIYVNQEKRQNQINAQNEVLANMGKQLDNLNDSGKDWSESKLHAKIDKIVGEWGDFFDIRVSRKSDEPRIKWRFKSRTMSNAERSYGKYMIYSTDESIPASEVVKTYFEKDLIEKVFRTLKTSEEIEPVRHRLEQRVRAYLFVCTLAYRLQVDIQNRLRAISEKEHSWEQVDDYLMDLGRIERTRIRFGQQVKTIFLNITKKIQDINKKIGFKDLFQDRIDVDFRL